MGCFVMAAWVLAFIFYMYIRITKTMDLGQYLAYGIYVLVVEVVIDSSWYARATLSSHCMRPSVSHKPPRPADGRRVARRRPTTCPCHSA